MRKTTFAISARGETEAHQVLLFRRKLMQWYRQHARTLPWRGVRDPYATWVSEIMLQQTRVQAVIEHYRRFLGLFPTVVSLALAPEPEVLAAWSGLGYYRRARMLHQAARFLVRERNGRLPETATELSTLPGIGEYTSAAIASIAFGESIAVLDGNVERVLLRLTGRAEDPTAEGRIFLRGFAAELVPHRRRGRETNAAGDHNQAMMELGATICLPRAPLCLHCPVYDHCETRGEHKTLARAAQKSRPAAYLLVTRKHGATTEVLVETRGAESSLMPGMVELPPLPIDAVRPPQPAREPLLRVRHAITNTNYYVEVYAESDEENSLRQAVPAAVEMLRWEPVSHLPLLPLTGLARKILMRVDLLAVAGPEKPEHDARRRHRPA